MREPTLYILDVGHGNSAVLVDTGGVVVIDAGPRTALLEFLKQEGISHVDVVLISHADKDHIEGLVSLIESEELTIGRVRVNTDLMKGTKLWADLLYLLDKSHRAKKLDFDVALTTKNTGEFDQGLIQIEILAPNLQVAGMGAGGGNHKKRVFRSNTVSAVIRLSKGTKPLALFAGDIDELGLEHLLGDFPAPTAPILVYPHHGGKSGANDEASFTRRLCEAVKPQTVIFSIGRGRHETPDPKIVATIRQHVPNIRVACTQLSQHCAASVPAIVPTHLTKHFAQGHEHNRCCAGTMVLRLGHSPPSTRPHRGQHSAFILRWASTALCQRA